MMDKAYSNIRTQIYPEFNYVPYTVVSQEPEDDAIAHVMKLAAQCGETDPSIIGWDFPLVSQEQINVYHMHGYVAAWVVPQQMVEKASKCGLKTQKAHKYCAITIKDPMSDPFTVIPGAYKTLMSYMQANGIPHLMSDDDIIPCFELQYFVDGVEYMDIYIAANI